MVVTYGPILAKRYNNNNNSRIVVNPYTVAYTNLMKYTRSTLFSDIRGRKI